MVNSIAMWDQCGGKGADCRKYECVDSAYKNTTCAPGSYCRRQDEVRLFDRPLSVCRRRAANTPPLCSDPAPPPCPARSALPCPRPPH